MPYFVITSDEDGGHVRQMGKEELEEALNPGGYLHVEPDYPKALASITESDINYWGYGFLIIEGEIVVPRVEKVVTRYVVV